MDDFVEQVVCARRRGVRDAVYVLCRIGVAATGLFALIALTDVLNLFDDGPFFNLAALARAVLAGGAAWLLWRASDRVRLEYDYTFTNGTLDVARVLNLHRRQPLVSLSTLDVQRAGRCSDAEFQKAARDPGVRKHGWYLHRDAEQYYFCFSKKGKRHLVILELNEALRRAIFQKKYFASGVVTGDLFVK